MHKLNPTKYYDEFLRYHEMAKWQHHNCNLGTVDYSDTPYDDDLIKNVFLYDVIARKYAGFSQLVLDIWYDQDAHPYRHKMSDWRKRIVARYENKFLWDVPEWLYIFFVHRLTGSGIHYGQNPSGYYNSVLLDFGPCLDLDEMVQVIKEKKSPMYSSIGYQIAAFPKPQPPYKRGGDYFLCEILPDLVRQFAELMQSRPGQTFREYMQWLETYNQKHDCRVFRFQYAAALSDIADFMPMFIDRGSAFFYGSNAKECIRYLFEKPRGMAMLDFLDLAMEISCKDTDGLPYNIEDVHCDSIRWIENYINPRGDYSHLNMDEIWSSHKIIDHPFGRQKPMLELGLVETFNGKPHPSDDKIIAAAGLTPEQYRGKVNDSL